MVHAEMVVLLKASPHCRTPRWATFALPDAEQSWLAIVVVKSNGQSLKKCQVDGDFVAVEPNVLFGNLEEICQVICSICISYEFCTEFYKLLLISKEKGCFGSIRILSPLLTNFFKNSSILNAYCANYKNALECLENLRKTDDRFVILEKVEILKFSVDPQDVDTLQPILDSLQESLNSIDDSIKWLHNFERLQELQKQLIWPTLSELYPKAYLPDETVARQLCETSIARLNRQLNYEGLLYCIENQKPCEVYLFLFNDMLLVTKIKENTLRSKVRNNVGQLIALYTSYAPTKECKETWIRRFQDSVSTIEQRHRQQRGLSQTLTMGHASASRSPTPSELSFKDCKSNRPTLTNGNRAHPKRIPYEFSHHLTRSAT
uniref:DH domain-containing protein n=1 Tax=Trichuris muris TaxID=70415 RepID=A0A5S6Q6V1_TRIMR